MKRALRVIKVGGSLLDCQNLPVSLHRWLDRQQPAVNVLIAGGGKLADVVRQADHLYQIGAERGHWLCVSLMTVSARLLACLLPAAQLVEDYDQLLARLESATSDQVVFGSESYLRIQEPVLPGERASHDWRTTSDTIAARLAYTLGADELVLLKSTSLPADTTRWAASTEGLVDEYFPVVAADLPVRWVNLRRADSEQQLL